MPIDPMYKNPKDLTIEEEIELEGRLVIPPKDMSPDDPDWYDFDEMIGMGCGDFGDD